MIGVAFGVDEESDRVYRNHHHINDEVNGVDFVPVRDPVEYITVNT